MAKSTISDAHGPNLRSSVRRPVSAIDRIVALVGVGAALLASAGVFWTLANDPYGNQSMELLTRVVVAALCAALIFLFVQTATGRWFRALSPIAPAFGLIALSMRQAEGSYTGLNFAARPVLWEPLVMLSLAFACGCYLLLRQIFAPTILALALTAPVAVLGAYTLGDMHLQNDLPPGQSRLTPCPQQPDTPCIVSISQQSGESGNVLLVHWVGKATNHKAPTDSLPLLTASLKLPDGFVTQWEADSLAVGLKETSIADILGGPAPDEDATYNVDYTTVIDDFIPGTTYSFHVTRCSTTNGLVAFLPISSSDCVSSAVVQYTTLT